MDDQIETCLKANKIDLKIVLQWIKQIMGFKIGLNMSVGLCLDLETSDNFPGRSVITEME